MPEPLPPAEDGIRRLGSLTAEDVAALDRAAVAAGVGVVQLMEVAGWQVARCAWTMLGDRPGRVAVVAGGGNNGGDGLVAARHLTAWGCGVVVVVLADGEAALREVPALQVTAARGAGVEVLFTPGGDVDGGLLSDAHVVLDALLGTGAGGDPRPAFARAIHALPPERTLAVDIPSGVDATTGACGEPAVQAARTCTLTAMKAGLWTREGRARAGRITVADIGMPLTAWRAAGLEQPEDVRGGALLTVTAATG